MLAVSAPIAAAAVGSYATVKESTVPEQESSFSDSAVVSDSQAIETPLAFDPNAVSVSSSTLMTALSFQEKYGNPESDEEEDGEEGSAETNPEEGEDAEELSDAEKAAAVEAEKEKNPTQLSDEELAVVQSLALQDAKTRNNEEAHVRVGGRYTSQPEYEYETGPDSRQYAISGHVDIDARSIAGNPEETIRKLRVVKRAALAPAEPSTEDRNVAAVASNGIQQAVGEIRERVSEDIRELRAQNKREAKQAALELARLEKSMEKEVTQESKAASSPLVSATQGDSTANGPSFTANPAQARIAAQALDRAASLAPSLAPPVSSLSNPGSANASVISNNDISFATVTAAPGVSFDTAV